MTTTTIWAIVSEARNPWVARNTYTFDVGYKATEDGPITKYPAFRSEAAALAYIEADPELASRVKPFSLELQD